MTRVNRNRSAPGACGASQSAFVGVSPARALRTRVRPRSRSSPAPRAKGPAEVPRAPRQARGSCRPSARSQSSSGSWTAASCGCSSGREHACSSTGCGRRSRRSSRDSSSSSRARARAGWRGSCASQGSAPPKAGPTVASVSADTVVVTTAAGNTVTISVDERTRVFVNGLRVTLADVHVGDVVVSATAAKGPTPVLRLRRPS